VKPLLGILRLEMLENEARQDASEAGMTFAKQPSREAQNAFLLDSHRAVMRFDRWFVLGWEHSSWSDQ